MTLKNYLNQNNIKATPDDRSRIGVLLSNCKHSYIRTIEDGHNVKEYEESFLDDVETQIIIINYLTKKRINGSV